MKIYNTLTKKIEEFKPLNGKEVKIYSCGPTVYDYAHIGNLSSYIYVDTLRRVLESEGYNVTHVMNYTDVDDKTIKKSQEKYPNLEPNEALKKLTDEYIALFQEDIKKVGIDVSKIEFVRATDNIENMKALIAELFSAGMAYVTDEGVYFSIGNYQAAGNDYGVLIGEKRLMAVAKHRIDNDEYSKDEATDFALWKKAKENEPAWDFNVGGHDLKGRPGWHIECSAMSEKALGIPFDIHTGGIDLIFPHHENEIAQSTGAKTGNTMANYFVHSNHLLVDGKKMAKSANNYYTLQDIIDKGYDPLAFRLLVLQSQYRNESNFTWDVMEAAQNRFRRWKNIAELRWQEDKSLTSGAGSPDIEEAFAACMDDDLNTAGSIEQLEKYLNTMESLNFCKPCVENIYNMIDAYFGLNIIQGTPNLSDEIYQTIQEREEARQNNDWGKSDKLRQELENQGIGIRDTENGPIWRKI